MRQQQPPPWPPLTHQVRPCRLPLERPWLQCDRGARPGLGPGQALVPRESFISIRDLCAEIVQIETGGRGAHACHKGPT